MAGFALLLLALAYSKGGDAYVIGLKAGWKLMYQTAPLLVFAFLIAGLVPALLPPAIIQKWVGAESGFRGILVGSLAGGLSPGGPYVSLPLAVGLVRAGAGVGVMVAYLTGWSLIAVARIPMEIGILGWRFTLIRLACTILFAPIAGLLANMFFGKVDISTGL
jgi:uncharacterized membrane protein YraQ (UPF0718 family)